MFRLISLYFLTALLAFPAYGGLPLARERPYQGNAVAEIIQGYCAHLIQQKRPADGTAKEMLHIRLDRFYAARGYQPLWINGQMVDEFMAAVEASAADGLNPSDYAIAWLREFGAHALVSPEKKGQDDILLTENLLLLASHLRYGKVDPVTLEPFWNHEKKNFQSLDEKLQRALAAGSITAFFNELRPQDVN